MIEIDKTCPDCNRLIYWDNRRQVYRHDLLDDCAYMENINGIRIWDNTNRDRRLNMCGQEHNKIQLDIYEQEHNKIISAIDETFSIDKYSNDEDNNFTI